VPPRSLVLESSVALWWPPCPRFSASYDVDGCGSAGFVRSGALGVCLLRIGGWVWSRYVDMWCLSGFLVVGRCYSVSSGVVPCDDRVGLLPSVDNRPI